VHHPNEQLGVGEIIVVLRGSCILILPKERDLYNMAGYHMNVYLSEKQELRTATSSKDSSIKFICILFNNIYP